jgi:hypothetical protein
MKNKLTIPVVERTIYSDKEFYSNYIDKYIYYDKIGFDITRNINNNSYFGIRMHKRYK